jgi:hypothetical protein
MKKQTKAIKTLFEVVLFTAVPTMATINCETHMPITPGYRLPKAIATIELTNGTKHQ